MTLEDLGGKTSAMMIRLGDERDLVLIIVCSHWPELESLAFPQPCHSKPGVSELQHPRGWDGLTWVKPGSGPGLGREGIAHLIGPGSWQLHSQGGLQRESNRLGFYCRHWGEEVPFLGSS